MKRVLLFSLLLSFTALAQTPPYKRGHWLNRWADADKNCRNTRDEVLLARSLETVKFKSPKECRVESGKWADFYHNGLYTNAHEVDIDHVVPLFEAHKSGGANWSRDQKRTFANDVENLVITGKRTNRQKGANTLKTWLPLEVEYACRYYQQWMMVKKKYQLVISEDEIKSLDVTKCRF